MSAPSEPAPFDPRPLTEPVDAHTARAYVRELRRSGRAPATNTVGLIVGIVVGGIFLVMFGTVFSGILGVFVQMSTSGGSGMGVLALVPFLVLILILVGGGFGIARLVRGTGAARWYRLDRFAKTNGMAWYPEARNPPLAGLIFGLGSSRTATDIVRGTTPRLVEFANYRYTTGSGKEQTTHRWGYVAVKLSTPLPHIVLDAVGNNGLFGSNLPAAFDKHQRLSLEGDFDQHFALYCPQGYERDALYLFTPDIMARFVDHAAALDVEIVDDWLFLYLQRDVSTLDPATWAWLFSVVGALLDKLAQWERWRDDRLAATVTSPGIVGPAGVPGAPGAPGGAGAPGAPGALPFAAPTAALRPPPGVAPQGQRLRRGRPWGFIIIGILFMGFWLLVQSGLLAGGLSGFLNR